MTLLNHLSQEAICSFCLSQSNTVIRGLIVSLSALELHQSNISSRCFRIVFPYHITHINHTLKLLHIPSEFTCVLYKVRYNDNCPGLATVFSLSLLIVFLWGLRIKLCYDNQMNLIMFEEYTRKKKCCKSGNLFKVLG